MNSKFYLNSKQNRFDYNSKLMKITLILLKLFFSTFVSIYLFMFRNQNYNQIIRKFSETQTQRQLLKTLFTTIDVLILYLIVISLVIYVYVVLREYPFGIAFMTGVTVWEVWCPFIKTDGNLLFFAITQLLLIAFVILAMDFVVNVNNIKKNKSKIILSKLSVI